MQVFQETSFEKAGINNQGSVSSDTKDVHSVDSRAQFLGLHWFGGRGAGWRAGTSLLLF